MEKSAIEQIRAANDEIEKEIKRLKETGTAAKGRG